MDANVEELCDQLDAAVFSGDLLHDETNLNEFSEMVERWGRAIAEQRRMNAERDFSWTCTECGSEELTSSVMESDLDSLACTNCGCNEFVRQYKD